MQFLEITIILAVFDIFPRQKLTFSLVCEELQVKEAVTESVTKFKTLPSLCRLNKMD